MITVLGPGLSLAAVLTLALLSWVGEKGCCEASLTQPADIQEAVAALRPDDGVVLKAVVEHSILPEAERAISKANLAPIVLIEERSVALCIDNAASTAPCRIPDHWQQLLIPAPSRGWPGMIGSDKRRRELVASLEARNALRHALPAIDHPSAVMIAVERSEEALRSYRGRAGGFSSLSLPGYAADGHALVYGSFYCGSLCGKSWLFVLKKSESKWQVESAVLTAIS